MASEERRREVPSNAGAVESKKHMNIIDTEIKEMLQGLLAAAQQRNPTVRQVSAMLGGSDDKPWVTFWDQQHTYSDYGYESALGKIKDEKTVAIERLDAAEKARADAQAELAKLNKTNEQP